MCGIAGIVHLDGLGGAEREALGPMVGSLRHRGPDDQGEFHDGFAALGHARLSIIDLASGHQPMCNEDGTVWIVFNGEIYNFPELYKSLQDRGHRFRSRCDTEAIVHLYEEHGERCVDHLRGMFAFAVWDQPRRRLLLARDRVGIKPLYYWQQGDRLAFGSEIKPVLFGPGVERRLDPEALQDYLTYLWIPAPKSIFRGIRKLPAGHTAVFDGHGLRLREYWDLAFPDPTREDPDRLAERFVEQLRESVRSHLIADVPLGAFLSGGLDSSSVVATMAAVTSAPVVTNSIGFEEETFNELPYADRVAERFRTDHHRYTVRPDAVEAVERLAWHFDEPFADSSAVPTYYVSRMARQNVTVALSGDGGDENMAGYRRYKFHQRERLVRGLLPVPLRRALFGSLARLYPKADWLPRTLRAKSTLENLASTELGALYRSRAVHDPGAARRLLSPGFLAELRGYDSMSVLEHHFNRCRTTDPLHRDLYVDVKTYLVDDILTKVDRASMAVSLEVRVPVLDHRFMEFMASVPPHLKLHGGEGKYLYKKAFRPILGADVVDRPKMGFCVPLGQWFRGPLRAMAQETLFAPAAFAGEVLDRTRLQRVWDEHQRGLRHHDATLWAVLMLEFWARNFMRAPAPADGSAGHAGGLAAAAGPTDGGV